MRKQILIFAAVMILLQTVAFGQTAEDSTHYKQLYYTAKVWGYLKYFHTAFESDDNNWDTELIRVLLNMQSSVTDQDFNNYISGLIDKPGPMAVPEPGSELPSVPDSLKFNLDLTWQHDTIFADSVIAKLDTIRVRFRPHRNYFVDQAISVGTPVFDMDDEFYQWGTLPYPQQEYRLLALFRYWNIINYYYPYKDIIDMNWDSVLVEFIPKMIHSADAQEFHLTFLELATRINDTHAFTYSSVISEDILGFYYFPLTLKYVEDETVITGVYSDSLEIQVGDVMKSINGQNIYALRDSLRKYVAGSNNPVIERNINRWLLRGQEGDIQIIVEDAENQKTVSLSRNIYISDYYELIEKTGPVWDILDSDSGNFGYVDMGRLEVDQISDMFSDLWETDGIIFDIRNYPQGTMWEMVKYLFDAPIHIANFTVPDIAYPGTLFWRFVHIGTGDFSQTYSKPIVILFDETTISHAEYTVMAFEQHPQSIKIGSQTAAADGNVSTIYLPGGIYTYFTALGVYYPDFTHTQRVGIIPDIEVHPTIMGIRQGRDEVLEIALKQLIINHVDDNISYKNTIIKFYLNQNYPNPFNPTTAIGYQLSALSDVELSIYNILGQKVVTLVDEKQKAGYHQVVWEASAYSSGVYYYVLKAGDFRDVKKMILLR
jgi:C-terminal processing protease CtpA/Prc